VGQRPALSWAELPDELARADLLGFAYLGTVRRDGWPRISPVEAHVLDGRLLIGVMPRSLKARDLERDPRCTLQSAVAGPDSGDPELKLYCRAATAVGETAAGWWASRTAEVAHVYELRVEEAALVEWDLCSAEMTVTSWSPEGGVQTTRRPYP
jgi:hypothetical protein